MSWDRFIQHMQDMMIWSLGLACITHFIQIVVYKVKLTDYSMAAITALITFVLYSLIVFIIHLIQSKPRN